MSATPLAPVLTLLATAVVTVVLCRRLKWPPMLGYLLVGLAIGPHALALIPSDEATGHLAEFGIVFLMFTLGLEFNLARLYSMKRIVFGLGAAQVIVTATLLAGLMQLAAVPFSAGLALGAALAMSSTAMVSKLLSDRNEMNTPQGRNAFGILLFQDLAVVPFLIIIPVLGQPPEVLWRELGFAGLTIAAVLLLLLKLGQQLMRPWFNLVARQHSSELFMLNVLLVTLGIAWITELAGLSLALGAFIAGMLISETEYRYQVEDDIRPFRDLLLGLFFVTVGMNLNLQLLLQEWWRILLLVLFLVPGKILIIAGVARLFGDTPGTALRTGFALGQGGEFAFVLLALAAGQQLIPTPFLQSALAAVIVSMLITPILLQHSDKLVLRLASSEWMNMAASLHQIAVRSMAAQKHVILCGYGRSGQSLGRILACENIPFFALDLDPEKVREASAAGESVVFGNAAKREVLLAAGLMRAQALVVTYSDTHSALQIIETVHQLRPGLPIIVRTTDDHDIEKLRAAGAAEVVAEIMEGSLMLASHALMLLGVPLNKVVKRIREVRESRYELIRGFYRGISEEFDEDSHQRQARLHTLLLSEGAHAIGKTLGELDLARLHVEIRSIRRRNQPPQTAASDFTLQNGDVLVLLGEPEGLAAAEDLLLQG
ncbi:monovalent cation:proton antiporter family protein [Chitinilyticum litopenaei]|uniref:monovalent cation:proton antiporter family protein n=1 Tax=Chitinilyticum litopenaei TaxID=1121276 RepID=UPI00040E5C50|nr:monovalent cation:proton antiporter family protein [Chitinilyticum litopenaei]